MAVYTSINDGRDYFFTHKYDGNWQSGDGAGYTRNITDSLAPQPDMVWVKARDMSGRSHYLFDSNRGFAANKELVPNSSVSEGDTGNHNTGANGFIGAAQSNGFTVTTGSGDADYVNAINYKYVGWTWKVNGGTTVSESNDNISSVRQTNATSGMSIISYDGATNANSNSNNNGGNYWKINHGLGVVPNCVLIKKRSGAADWYLYADVLGAITTGKHLVLSTDAATATETELFGTSGSFTTSQIQLGGWDVANRNGSTYVAYVFAEKQGFSKFGSYIGNGNVNGTFVYTGFKPSFVMVKSLEQTGHWTMTDDKRQDHTPGNSINKALYANNNFTEGSVDPRFEYYSNGFKCRRSHQSQNNDGFSYFFMAFAENPFVSSAGVPATAK